jgi:hypothetical protein
MGDVGEQIFKLMPARQVAWILAGALATWGGLWLLIAALKPLTVDPTPPPAGFFLAMLPVVLLVAAGPIWGLGGTLVVTTTPGRVVVRHDRPGRRGTPLSVAIRGGARPQFAVERMRSRRNRNYGVLLVSGGDGFEPTGVMAGFELLTGIAAELNGQASAGPPA